MAIPSDSSALTTSLDPNSERNYRKPSDFGCPPFPSLFLPGVYNYEVGHEGGRTREKEEERKKHKEWKQISVKEWRHGDSIGGGPLG